MKKFILAIGLLALGCGTEVVEVPTKPAPQQPGPGPGPGPDPGPDPGEKPTFAEMQDTLGEYCAGCHANSPWLTSEFALKASTVRERILNRTMPTSDAPKQFDKDTREWVLSYF